MRRIKATLDDGGKPVTLLNGEYGNQWPLASDKRLAALVLRLRSAARGSLLFQSLPIVLGCAWLIGVLELTSNNHSFKQWAVLTLGVLPGFAAACTTGVLRRWRFAEKVKSLVLEEGMCAACGYNLVGICTCTGTDQVVCPECGASWRASRIARSVETVGNQGLVFSAAVVFDSEIDIAVKGVDDRGLPRTLASPRLLRQRRRAAARAERSRLHSAGRSIAARSRSFRMGIGSALVLPAASIFVLFLLPRTARASLAAIAPLDAFYAICVILVIAILGSLYLVGRLGIPARDIKAALLEASFCPACASPLDTLPPDPLDGCVVCEVCRAAWKLPSTAAAPPPATLPP